jgi:hypothetical protein
MEAQRFTPHLFTEEVYVFWIPPSPIDLSYLRFSYGELSKNQPINETVKFHNGDAYSGINARYLYGANILSPRWIQTGTYSTTFKNIRFLFFTHEIFWNRNGYKHKSFKTCGAIYWH